MFGSLSLPRPPKSGNTFTPMPFGKISVFGFTSGESQLSIREWDEESSRLTDRGKKRDFIDMVLVTVRFPREWYPTAFGDSSDSNGRSGNKPPLCTSADGVWGNPTSIKAWQMNGYTGECQTCGMAEFGGGCKPVGVVFVLDPKTNNIYWVRIPTTSVSNVISLIEEFNDRIMGSKIRIATEDTKTDKGWMARISWEVLDLEYNLEDSVVDATINALSPHLKPSERPIVPELPNANVEIKQVTDGQGGINWEEEY